MKKYANKVFTPLIVLMLLIFAAIIYLSFRQTAEAKAAASLVAHSQEVLFHTAKVLSTIVDNETRSRGFVLTAQPSFLGSIEQSKVKVHLQIDTLRRLTKDNPFQQTRIDSIVWYADKRLTFSDSIIAVRRREGLQAAIAIILTGNGDGYTDMVRGFTEEMQHAENALLNERKINNERATHFQNNIIIAIIIVISTLLIAFIRKDYLAVNDRKTAERTIKKNEVFLDLMANNIRDYAIFMLDGDGLVVSWNRGAETVLGYDKWEITGKPFSFMFTQKDIDENEPVRNLALAKKYGQYETEGLRTKKGGQVFWANLVFTALFNETGAFYGYSAIIRDITERKKAQEQLVFLSQQINYSNDAIFVVDANRKIKSWNRGAESLYGYSSWEVLEKDSNEVLKTNLSEAEIKDVLKIIARKDYWTGELRRQTKKGEVIYVHSSSSTIRDNKGNITGYVAVSFDITAQKELRERVNHLASMVEQSSEAIISIGRDQRIISWNNGAGRLYGYGKEEAIGKTATALKLLNLANIDLEKLVEHVFDTGDWKAEMKCLRKDESTFFGAITANLVKNEQGDKVAIVFIVKDISERRQLEEQLTKSNEDLEHKVTERTAEIRQREEEYRYLFENNPMPMYVMDQTTFKFLDVNEMAIRHYGYSREEFLSMTVLDIRPEKDKQLFLKTDHSFETTPASNDKQTWNHLKKDQTLIKVEISAHQINFKNRKARLILSNDITEKWNAEQRLLTSEKRFRALIENNYDIISLMDASFKVIYRSPSGARITGWTDEEMKGMNGTSNIHPDDLEKSMGIIHKLMANPGMPVEASFRNRHKDGHYLWVEGVVINLLHDEDVQAIVFNFRDVTERVQAVEKLAASEVRFRSLIENSAEGVSLLDQFSNVVYRSPSAYKIIGDSPVTNSISYAHPDDKEIFKVKFAEALSKPRVPVNYKLRYYNASGYYFWTEGTFTNLLDVSGVHAVVANYRDITKRVEAEEKLITSEKQFRHTLDNMLEGVQIIGFDWRYIYVNDSVTLHARCLREDLIGYTMMEKYPGVETTELFSICQRCFAERISFHIENKFVFPDQRVAWFELSLQPVPEGIFILSVDITDRKKADERLVKSEQLYRSLFENMLHGFSYSKGYFEEGRLTDYMYLGANSEFEKMTGMKDVAGKRLSELLPGFLTENPGYAEIIGRVALEGKAEKFETFAKHLNKWLSVSLYSPEKGYFVALTSNITEQKQVEYKIKKLNKELEERVARRTAQLKKTNEELEAFSYSVSHDLRAPLRAIIGFTAILEEDYSSQLDEEAKRITTVIKNNTMKMGYLIDDLLTFSRMGRQDIVKTHIDTDIMVREITAQPDMKYNGNRQPVKWILHDLPNINGDANTLRQVWINLISNAVKYSGKVVSPEVEIGFYHEHDKNVFFIKDNGVGFDEKYKNKLFRVFQRLHSSDEFEGTGIGLAIVEKIVSKHDGTVWAEGTPNEGATFYFSLPA